MRLPSLSWAGIFRVALLGVVGIGSACSAQPVWSETPSGGVTPSVQVTTPKSGEAPAADRLQVAPRRQIRINIPSRTLELIRENPDSTWSLEKSYPVGVGRPGFPTPVGEFAVLRKVKSPGWEHPYRGIGDTRIAPGQSNPLGTRWIGFKATPHGEFGIHGTPNVRSVGQLSSHGCIRMRIPDVEDLFNRVSVGTPVRVTYETTRPSRTPDGQLTVVRYPDVYRRGTQLLAKQPAKPVQPKPVDAVAQQQTGSSPEPDEDVSAVLPEGTSPTPRMNSVD